MDGIMYVVKTGCRWRSMPMTCLIGQQSMAILTLGVKAGYGSRFTRS
ncbi:transposase [Rhodocytophaga rosea]|uniref:Transposase n=1 Tax=Rhodocytophaga rosea TaxID=2704465 RepID=A0A6C0GB49_9BACT|nr:transposase [Rhodocytophaga rosea]